MTGRGIANSAAKPWEARHTYRGTMEYHHSGQVPIHLPLTKGITARKTPPTQLPPACKRGGHGRQSFWSRESMAESTSNSTPRPWEAVTLCQGAPHVAVFYKHQGGAGPPEVAQPHRHSFTHPTQSSEGPSGAKWGTLQTGMSSSMQNKLQWS